MHLLHTFWVNLEDTVISFDAISLFTKVPIMDALNLLGQQFDENVKLIHHVLLNLFTSVGRSTNK
jgi:hypothetical protein